MSLLLFEPFIWNDINDYPDLGSAMLVGACKSAGIDTQLVPTQRSLLRKLFVESQDELAEMIGNLAKSRSKAAILHTVPNMYGLLRKEGKRGFSNQLSRLYYHLISGRWSDFLDSSAIEWAVVLFREMARLNEYYMFERNDSSTPIVRHILDLIEQTTPPPDYIGLSFYQFSRMNLSISTAVQRMTRKTVIIGGAATGHISQEGLRWLREIECADYLIIGPGEESLPSLIRRLDARMNTSDLRGTFQLRTAFNSGTVTEQRPVPIRNLDDLPYPDFSMSDIEGYGGPSNVLPLQTARGCSWKKCAFCSHHKGYLNEYNVLSMGRLIDIIKYYNVEYRCKHIILHDDEIPPRRAAKIADAILREGLEGTRISCYTRPVRGYKHEGRLVTLKRAGFVAFNWGVESGSQEILDKTNKGTNVKDIVGILEATRRIGFSNTCWLMLGIPTETKDDMEKTLSLIKRVANSVDVWLVSLFSLQKDSKMASDAEQWGISLGSERADSLNYSLENVVLKKGPPRQLINEYKQKINRTLRYGLSTGKGFDITLPRTNRARIIPFLLRSHRTKFQISYRDSEANGQMILALGTVRMVDGVPYFTTHSNRALQIDDYEKQMIEGISEKENWKASAEKLRSTYGIEPTEFASRFDKLTSKLSKIHTLLVIECPSGASITNNQTDSNRIH